MSREIHAQPPPGGSLRPAKGIRLATGSSRVPRLSRPLPHAGRFQPPRLSAPLTRLLALTALELADRARARLATVERKLLTSRAHSSPRVVCPCGLHLGTRSSSR